jgi:hypothetical protein
MKKMKEHDAAVIPSEVIELALKAEEIDGKAFTKKAIFDTVLMVAGIVIAAVDLWVISQGLVESIPGRRLAAFVLLGACALSIVGLVALVTLMLSAFVYQRLSALVDRSEKNEVIEEEDEIIWAVVHATSQLEKPWREKFLNDLSDWLRSRPVVAKEIMDRLSHSRER